MTKKEAKEKLYMEWQKFLENNLDYAGISEAYKMAFKALEQEEKQGEWMPVKGYEGILWECSECHDKRHHTTIKWNYCPSCGANMVDKTLISEPIKRKGLKDILEDDPSLTEKISVEEFEARTGRKIILEETDDEND